MRRAGGAALLLTAALAWAADPIKSGPAVGQDMPGSFQVLRATGKTGGELFCPVCEQGLYPGVLVFTAEMPEAGKPVARLLQKLDELIDSHQQTRLGACAVVLNDGGYREALESKVDDIDGTRLKVADAQLTKALLSKDQRVAQLDQFAKEAKLKNVILALAPESGPPGYKLSRDAGTTVLVYEKLRVVANHAYPGAPSAEQADQVAAEVQKLVEQIEAAENKSARPAPGRQAPPAPGSRQGAR